MSTSTKGFLAGFGGCLGVGAALCFAGMLCIGGCITLFALGAKERQRIIEEHGEVLPASEEVAQPAQPQEITANPEEKPIYLDDALRKLSLEVPLPFDELKSIAMTGLKNGVPRENIVEFTRTTAQLNIVSNNPRLSK